jgi:4-hydroxy-tetrahydrodipicolinate synthase
MRRGILGPVRDDFFTYPLLCLGGHGIISVVSNVAPKDMADMIDAFEAGDLAKARSSTTR